MRKITLFALLLTLFISSCTIQKRTYMPGYSVRMNHLNHKAPAEIKQPITDSIVGEELTASIHNEPLIIVLDQLHEIKNEPCDLIILKNGDEIQCKVSDIGLSEIKYKKCDNLTGPTISIKKDDVFIIKYANGAKDVFSTADKKKEADDYIEKKPSKEPIDSKENNSEKKTNIFALLGFILSVVGLLIGLAVLMEVAIPLAILGIVFSAIGKGQIKKHPEKYKGKSLAGWGIVIGILTLVLIAAVLALLGLI